MVNIRRFKVGEGNIDLVSLFPCGDLQPYVHCYLSVLDISISVDSDPGVSFNFSAKKQGTIDRSGKGWKPSHMPDKAEAPHPASPRATSRHTILIGLHLLHSYWQVQHFLMVIVRLSSALKVENWRNRTANEGEMVEVQVMVACIWLSVARSSSPILRPGQRIVVTYYQTSFVIFFFLFSHLRRFLVIFAFYEHFPASCFHALLA